MSDDVLGRIAGWCLADPKLSFLEEGPAVEVAGDPPLRLNLAVTGEEVLLSHRLGFEAGEGALARALSLVNRRGSLMRGTASGEAGAMAIDLEYPIYLDGLTRQNFLLATQEMAAAADAVAALGPAEAAPAEPEVAAPEVVIEPAPAYIAPVVADTIELPPSPAPAAAFLATHEVPAGGMSAWASPDPSLQPMARLDARVQLRVDERRGAWALVTGSNGWSGCVDDRRLAPLGGAPAYAAPAAAPVMAPAMGALAWAATHQAPRGGMQAWATPDPSAAPSAELADRVQLRVEETRGAWARVTGSNGWTGWVDARRLEPAGAAGGRARGGFTIRPLPLVGGIALIVATFLAWTKAVVALGGAAWPSANGWDFPFAFLWEIDTPGDQPRLGLILLIVGILALGTAFIPRIGRGLAALTGVLGAAIGGVYIFQVTRFWGRDPVSASAGDVLSNVVGIAPWVALGGALLLLIGAFIPDRRA